jgi:hypothetical protein
LKDHFVDAFAFPVTFAHEVVEDVFEVGDKHKLYEMLILFQVKVLKEYLVFEVIVLRQFLKLSLHVFHFKDVYF